MDSGAPSVYIWLNGGKWPGEMTVSPISSVVRPSPHGDPFLPIDRPVQGALRWAEVVPSDDEDDFLFQI